MTTEELVRSVSLLSDLVIENERVEETEKEEIYGK
jgi:hypothetical protein